jgi:hypothetical protein
MTSREKALRERAGVALGPKACRVRKAVRDNRVPRCSANHPAEPLSGRVGRATHLRVRVQKTDACSVIGPPWPDYWALARSALNRYTPRSRPHSRFAPATVGMRESFAFKPPVSRSGMAMLHRSFSVDLIGDSPHPVRDKGRNYCGKSDRQSVLHWVGGVASSAGHARGAGRRRRSGGKPGAS